MFEKSQFYITQRFYISLAHVNQHPNFTYKILGYLKDSDTGMYPLCEQAYNNVIIVIIHGFHDFNKQKPLTLHNGGGGRSGKPYTLAKAAYGEQAHAH